MKKCPTCAAPLAPGVTICEECGTELIDMPPAAEDERGGGAEAPSDEPVAVSKAAESERRHTLPEAYEGVAAFEQAGREGGDVEASVPASEELCPECDEEILPDANGWCPLCGAILNDPWGDDPLDPHLEDDPDALGPPPWTMTREHQTAAIASSRRNDVLLVEADAAVIFDGRPTRSIILRVDEIAIGRIDPESGVAPDLDLSSFRQTDPHISRRHARLVRKEGAWLLEDLCGNDATWINDPREVLNRERRALQDGDRIGISDSVVLRYVQRDEKS